MLYETWQSIAQLIMGICLEIDPLLQAFQKNDDDFGLSQTVQQSISGLKGSLQSFAHTYKELLPTGASAAIDAYITGVDYS